MLDACPAERGLGVSSIWPDDHRFGAFFSFDVDGESWLLVGDSRNAYRPVTMSQASYGPKHGVGLILDILKAVGITTSTFFVPSMIAQRYRGALAEIVTAGHEVAIHGHVHEQPTRLSESQEATILEKSIRIIEGITGKRPIGYRAPGAEVSPQTNRLLVEHGIEYSSHYMDSPYPYFHEDSDLLELPIHWVCDDWSYSMVSTDSPNRTLIRS